MRMVTKDMVTVENGRFSSGAKGWFSVAAKCPTCGEERNVTVPLWEQGKQWTGQANCNKGHGWTVRANVVR